MESDGVELRGTARILTYGAATCHVLEEKYDEDEYASLKANEGQPLDLWQLDFSVHNGSGKALDHLIARYSIETQWPPCTNWSYKPGVDASEASWSSDSGHIQRTGEPYSVAPGETVTEELFFIVFHEDEPRFERWSVDYNFAEGTHVTPGTQASSPQAASPAGQPAQAPAATPLSVPGLPAAISAGDTCAGKPEGSSCWMELDNEPGCYLWNSNLQMNEAATWTGGCAGGLAEGLGEITWISGSDWETNTGQLQRGRYHGKWVFRNSDGGSREGSYVDGKRHGYWVLRLADGSISEGPYVDGKRHGRWIEHWSNGTVLRGMYVDGKEQGPWVYRNREGEEGELNYVDGELQF